MFAVSYLSTSSPSRLQNKMTTAHWYLKCSRVMSKFDKEVKTVAPIHVIICNNDNNNNSNNINNANNINVTSTNNNTMIRLFSAFQLRASSQSA